MKCAVCLAQWFKDELDDRHRYRPPEAKVPEAETQVAGTLMCGPCARRVIFPSWTHDVEKTPDGKRTLPAWPDRILSLVTLRIS